MKNLLNSPGILLPGIMIIFAVCATEKAMECLLWTHIDFILEKLNLKFINT